MPDATTPLDLDAIRARANAATEGRWEDFLLLSESGKRKRYEVAPASDSVHEIARLSLAHEADAEFIAHARADVPALVAEVEHLRAELDQAAPHITYAMGHLDGARAARPAPAWDEEAVTEAVASALFQRTYPGSTTWDALPVDGLGKEVWRESAKGLLAVVREHLPVKPGREDVYRAWHGTDDPWGGCADRASIERVLDLLPGRSEAEVKAEALREWVEDVTGDLAATKAEGIDLGRKYLHGMRSALMQATERADRLAAEGGDDRG